jgi:hypothetical protein
MKTLTGVIALVLALLFGASNGVVAAEQKSPPTPGKMRQPATKACPGDKVPGLKIAGTEQGRQNVNGGWVKCDCDSDGTFERECGSADHEVCCKECCAAAAGDPVIRKTGPVPPPRPFDPKGLEGR